MAYKEKDTKKWTAQWFETNAKGEKKKRRKRGFETKREALEYERQKKLNNSISMDMKLSEFMEVYFEDKQNELKERTMKNKRYMMGQHIIPYFGNQMMSEITAGQIIQWQNEMQTKGFSEAYLRMIQNQLTSLFTHASRIYDLHTNPCKKVKRMGSSDNRSLDFWTVDDYQKFIQTMEPESRYSDVMERYEIRWKQLGTKNEHLSVYDFKKKKRKEEVQELDRVIDAKNKEITDKEEKNVELARDISEKKEAIDKIDVIIHDKELDVTAVQILKEAESEKLDKLSIKRREVEETIENLNTQVAEVKDEIGQLGDERSAIKDEIDNMNNRKDNLSKKLDDLEFERFSKEFYIAGLKDENDKMQKEINNKQAVLDEIKAEIVSKQNSIDELKEEIRRGENELEGMVDGLIEEQEESEKCKKELAGYHDEMLRIERENQRMIYKENELNSPEWSLAKPARFMSAMDFFQNVALPLVEKLKNVIRSLYREVIALRNKVKEVDDYYEYKEKTTEYVVKLRMENEKLKQTQEAYENVKTAIGEDELKRLENIGRQQRLGLHVVGEYGILDKVKRR